jgi:outer membrane protein assembly factor BamB
LAGSTLWPQFRGPTGDGIVAEGRPPQRWSETEGITWKMAVPGKGWSSPVVADGQIWLTTAEEVEASEQEKLAMLKEAGVEERKFKELQAKKAVTLKVLCLDFATGERRHEITLKRVESPSAIHHFNSYASPTSVIDGERIICHFGTFGTYCLRRDSGEMVWENTLKIEHGVGPGSSPHVHEDKVILICDGTDQQFVAALNKETGEEIWRRQRPPMDAETGDRMKAYCTPISIVDPRGRVQLICMGSQWLVALEPETGEEIWRVRHGTGFSIVPRPVYHAESGTVFVCTGYGKPQLWAVKVDGEGDVTETHVVWTETKRIPAKPSPILVGDTLFLTDDAGIVSSFDVADGTLHWQERVGGNFTASPILAGGQLYFASESGTVTLVEPSAAFQVTAENTLDAKLMASPVVIGDSLLLRSETHLYRID